MAECMKYGQFVIGAPGSGKTTFCHGLEQYFKAVKRPFAIVNLDPANDRLPYEWAIDLAELITLEDVMEEMELGPNGGLTYWIEFLEQNVEWLKDRINKLFEGKSDKEAPYMIFDLPGQVELYTNHFSLKNIVEKLNKELSLRMSAVHILDGTWLVDTTKYISSLLLWLTAMIGMEMPFLSVLNKINLLSDFPRLKFRLNDFLTTDGLNYILQSVEIAESMKLKEGMTDEYEQIKQGFFLKYKGINAGIADLLEDYSNVSLVPFDITDKRYMAYVIGLADKANGFASGGKMSSTENKIDYRAIMDYMAFEAASELQEKYLDKDDFDY